MQLRDWHKNALLCAGTLAVCMAIGEIVVRMLWQPGGQQSVIRADPVYGWALRAGSRQHSVHTDRGLDYHIRINDLGLRDRERAIAPAAHRRRVLFLGDSFVFGAGVEAERRCTDRLEALLGPDVEVWNAGVSGWGTDQEFLFLCREALDWHPDAVVVGLCMLNDVLNNMLAHELFGTAPKPRFVLDASGALALQPPASRPPPRAGRRAVDVLKHSRFLHYIGRHARMLRAPSPRPVVPHPYYPEDLESDHSHWAVYRVPYTARFDSAFAVTEALLAAMRDSCAAHGVPVVWLAFPQKVEVDDGARAKELAHYGYDPALFDLRVPYLRLEALASRLGVPLVYPLAQFRAAAEPLFFAHDGHPNAAGHARAASALAPAVRDVLDALAVRVPAPLEHATPDAAHRASR
jgi:lysophospholipase L1-like esterase